MQRIYMEEGELLCKEILLLPPHRSNSRADNCLDPTMTNPPTNCVSQLSHDAENSEENNDHAATSSTNSTQNHQFMCHPGRDTTAGGIRGVSALEQVQ